MQNDIDKQWQAEIDAANQLYQQKQFEAAEQKFQNALALAQEFGTSDPRLATTLNNLGLLYYAQKQLDKAEPLYRQAIEIRENFFGGTHPMIAASMHNLALLLYTKGQLAEAESFALRSLKIKEAMLTPAHLEVATGLDTLAIICSAQKKWADAYTCYDRALKIRQQSLEAGHPLLIKTQENLQKIEKVLEKLGIPYSTENSRTTPQSEPSQTNTINSILENQSPQENHFHKEVRHKRRLAFSALDSQVNRFRKRAIYPKTKRTWGWSAKVN